ncbi:MAG: CHAT domain-containing protein [Microcoleaceae cyanobacterium]
MKLAKFLKRFLLTQVRKGFWRSPLLICTLSFILCLIFSPIIAQGASRLDAVASTPSEVTQASDQNPVERAKSLYTQQRYREAIQAWQEAIDRFAQQNDRLNQAISLSNLSLVYQQTQEWDNATQAVTNSLALLQQLKATEKTSKIRAQALDIQGSLKLTKGDAEAALKTWKIAADIYQDSGSLNYLTRNQINQAQALQALGRYGGAEDLLQDVTQQLENQPDSAEKVAALASLGDVYRVVGNLAESRNRLNQSLELARNLDLTESQAAILISLGNVDQSAAAQIVNPQEEESKANAVKEFQAEAKQNYQIAATISNSPLTQVKARLNQLSLAVLAQQWNEAEELQAEIQRNLQQSPRSQTTIYSELNLAQNLMCWAAAETDAAQYKSFSPLLQSCPILTEQARSSENPKTSTSSTSWEVIRKITQVAIQDARSLQSPQAEAYALGYLAATYQQEQNFMEAEKYTRQALGLISSYEAGEIAYLLQWQLGRLQKIQQKTQPKPLTDPTNAYNLAFQTLGSIRRDLLAISSDVRYSFRDSIEPLYREYVDLLLSPDEPQPSLDNLKQARTVLEALQLAEINDFFQDACTEAKPQEIDAVIDATDTPTTVVYPIILEDRIEVILKLPGQDNFAHYRTKVTQTDVEQTVSEIQPYLVRNPFGFVEAYKNRARIELEMASAYIYDWLLREAEPLLAESQSTTLVFVLDGALRKIPMAVLYDDQTEQYLIQKYAIALAPGLQLLNPRPFSEASLNALLAGVGEQQTIEGKEFSPLEQVQPELESIEELVRLGEERLLNEEFNLTNLESQLEQTDLTILHVATHGEFNSNLDDSFIVAWNKLITVREIDRLLREQRADQAVPIELLTLSACETAEGDDRAILGIAGVAVRAGARSTVATLWKVSDASTAEFMRLLYQELKQANESGTVDKAKALQKVQRYFLEDQETEPDWKLPYYWAPFVLIGNWL